MKIALSVLLVVAVAQVLATQSDDEAWIEYKIKFGKSHNRDDDAFRKERFLKTHRLIKEHNSSGKSWTLAHNHFSDWTEEEVERTLNNKLAVDPRLEAERLASKALTSSAYTFTPLKVTSFNASEYPAKLDYRIDGGACAIKDPARDQGYCGSCYVFAAMPPLEYAACKKFGKMTLLSDQQVLDCNCQDGGCGGGTSFNVWHQLSFFGAVPLTAYKPYKAKMEFCDMCNVVGPLVYVRPTGVVWGEVANGVTMAQAMVLMLNKYGPITVSINVPNNFQTLMNYGDGVYDDPTCNTARNHAVVLVGYGTSSLGKDFWVFRNSWGANWGKSGYGIIRRGANRCGFEESAWAVVV